MPRATLNIKTVDGFNATPDQPIIPAVTNKGITFGIREHNNILNERKRKSIQTAMSKNAHAMLSLRPLMMNLLPSKNVMLVPVSVTL